MICCFPDYDRNNHLFLLISKLTQPLLDWLGLNTKHVMILCKNQVALEQQCHDYAYFA